MQKEIKTKYYVFMVILCALFFVCGYKYGDSMGYEDGYNEGYRYDCRDEIALLYKRVKSQSTAIDAMNAKTRVLARENDSLKHKEKYYLFAKERLQLQKQFKKDSVIYYKSVRAVNDSLTKVTGFRDIIAPNGRPNPGVCASYPSLVGLRECSPSFRLQLPKKR